jgi:hypothetical protein
MCSDDVAKGEQVAKFMKNSDFDNFFYLGATINELLVAIPELKV